MNKTLPKGHKSCLDRSFVYTASGSTNIRETFSRARDDILREIAKPVVEPISIRRKK